MKYTDNILLIAAGYSLYTLTVVFSIKYFAGINQLIPDIFSDSASISLGNTFHQVIGSLITGTLLVRFGARPILLAFIIAVVLNFESYITVLGENSFKKTMDYYLTYPSALLDLIKPLVILPLMTYLTSLIKRTEPPVKNESDEY